MLHYCFTPQSLLREDKPRISAEVMYSSVSIGQRICQPFLWLARTRSVHVLIVCVQSLCVCAVLKPLFICSVLYMDAN